MHLPGQLSLFFEAKDPLAAPIRWDQPRYSTSGWASSAPSPLPAPPPAFREPLVCNPGRGTDRGEEEPRLTCLLRPHRAPVPPDSDPLHPPLQLYPHGKQPLHSHTAAEPGTSLSAPSCKSLGLSPVLMLSLHPASSSPTWAPGGPSPHTHFESILRVAPKGIQTLESVQAPSESSLGPHGPRPDISSLGGLRDPRTSARLSSAAALPPPSAGIDFKCSLPVI